jgi:hypothetical protein
MSVVSVQQIGDLIESVVRDPEGARREIAVSSCRFRRPLLQQEHMSSPFGRGVCCREPCVAAADHHNVCWFC